jgi:hypothetical protein
MTRCWKLGATARGPDTDIERLLNGFVYGRLP